MVKFGFSLILSLFCLTFVCGDHVPVYLFGKSLPFRVPALKTLQTDEFTNLIKSQVSDETVTVIFVEPKLSVEDLSQCKTKNGATCFKELSSFKDRAYFPSVDDAVNGLYDNLESNKATIDESDDILEAVEGGNKVIFVYLDVATEKEDFVNHDTIIGKTFAKLSEKYKNIVALYTGQKSNLERHSRERRQVAGGEKPSKRSGEINKKPVNCDYFVIAAASVVQKASSAEKETINDFSGCTSTLADKVLTVTINPSELSMKFKQYGGTWYLSGAEKAGKSYKFPAYVYANTGFAYRCGGDFTFTDDTGASIKIRNSQFMPDFAKQNDPAFNKDKYVYCEGYWSPGILAALFVVIIFIVILFIGLSWIMDINTMDKFDDPKGKTITINANE